MERRRFLEWGLTAGAMAAAGAAAAQEEKKEPPVDLLGLFKMHYANRVASFTEQNRAYQNVVLVGDSITEGFEVPKYFPQRRVLNRGIGGDVLGNGLAEDDRRGLLRRLDASIFDCGATEVFLLIGINDLNSGRTPEQMEPGYREIFRRIRERVPAVRVHVQSVLPTRGDFAARNAAVREVNTRLKRLADEFKYPYLDLHALFSEGGELKRDFTPDGLHLTDAAYRVWRGEIEKILGW